MCIKVFLYYSFHASIYALSNQFIHAFPHALIHPILYAYIYAFLYANTPAYLYAFIYTIIHSSTPSECVARYTYKAQYDDDISIATGDVIFVNQVLENGWWRGVKGSVEGFFPSSYVKHKEASNHDGE